MNHSNISKVFTQDDEVGKVYSTACSCWTAHSFDIININTVIPPTHIIFPILWISGCWEVVEVASICHSSSINDFELTKPYAYTFSIESSNGVDSCVNSFKLLGKKWPFDYPDSDRNVDLVCKIDQFDIVSWCPTSLFNSNRSSFGYCNDSIVARWGFQITNINPCSCWHPLSIINMPAAILTVYHNAVFITGTISNINLVTTSNSDDYKAKKHKYGKNIKDLFNHNSPPPLDKI